mmetsp:Transcript_38372/g.73533  ORF Transcript_38372/g.73533 Transcript_38372/m.73533 type:complete len:516 (+) Transcript_38372:103-1650(+)
MPAIMENPSSKDIIINSHASDKDAVRRRVEEAKARAQAKVQEAQIKREKLLIQAKSKGARGVWLPEEKRVVSFDQEHRQQGHKMALEDATTMPPMEYKPIDKRMLRLNPLWRVSPVGGEGTAVIGLALSPDQSEIVVATENGMVGALACADGQPTRALRFKMPALARQLCVTPSAKPGHWTLVCGLDDASCAIVEAAPPPEIRPQAPSEPPADAPADADADPPEPPPPSNWEQVELRLSPESFRERAKKSYEVPAAKWAAGRKKLSCRAVAVLGQAERLFVGSPLFEDTSLFSWGTGHASASSEHNEQHSPEEKSQKSDEEPEPEAKADVLRGHTDKVTALLLNQNGSRLWSASADKNIILWDTRTLAEIRTLKGHTGGIRSLVLSPDADVMYSGGADKGIRAWDAASGMWLRTFVGGHAGFVTAMVVSPDGQVLFSGDESTYGDSSIKAWRTGDGECILTVENQKGGIHTLAVSSDGAILYSGAGDGSLVAYKICRENRVLQKHGTKLGTGFLQ